LLEWRLERLERSPENWGGGKSCYLGAHSGWHRHYRLLIIRMTT